MHTGAIFIISLAFAFFALTMASNYLKKPWTWYATGGAVFVLSFALLKLELIIPFCIMAGIFVVIWIYLLIVRQINKRR